MAQVASVYTVAPNSRTPEQIVSRNEKSKAPKVHCKRVWAGIAGDSNLVISGMIEEAVRRDPRNKKEWVALMDGQEYQRETVELELKKRGRSATFILDIVHVIEYLWKAARAFYSEGSREGEEWVNYYLLKILQGHVKQAAAGMRRSATRQGVKERGPVDRCAAYLHNNAAYMNYDQYLAKGMPIATGVIEGACRHLVKDRMDVTGARWSLSGAEAVLKLRAVHSSGDWDAYWKFHERAEYERNHESRYKYSQRLETPKLQLVQ
jgi:hypothetical protein